MLNYLWAGMICIGVLYGTLQGNVAELTNAALDASKEAVTLCITMVGVMSFWMGMMRIAEQSGLTGELARKIRPFVQFMFPNIPEGHKANEYITTNVIANILGLGWAATPAGLKAMEELGKLNQYRQRASNEMCSFLILNISSLQLIPMNLIAYRSQYGSVNPTAVIGPAILATTVSTAVGVVFARCMDRRATG